MQHGAAILGLLLPLVLVGGPALLGLAGLSRGPSASPALTKAAWDWRLAILSTLLYVLAYNLTFFIQELFLVVPKALTPGLRPTLFHNNHSWAGSHPLETLFQGTGALAIFLSGLLSALLLARSSARSAAFRLFLIWMTFHGLLQSLPQLIIGAVEPRNDVGMAMDYFRLQSTAKTAIALIALALIPLVALSLTRPLLRVAAHQPQVATRSARSRFILNVATLPAVVAIALIIPFRVPREWIEVIAPPVMVAIAGIPWMQANAWRVADVRALGPARVLPIGPAFAALVLLLLIFQLVLRPGIAFY